MQDRSWLIVVLVLLGGAGHGVQCLAQDTEDAPVVQVFEATGEVAIEDEAWYVALVGDRMARDEMIRTSSTSPMAGIQYLKSEADQTDIFLSQDEKTFGLAYEKVPGAVIRITREDGSWRWHDMGQKIQCRVREDELPSGSALDDMAIFSVGNLSLSFYPDESRVTFIVFDPQRSEMKAFQALLYYPPAEDFAVDARLERLEKAGEVIMLTSRNLEKTFYRYATIHFRLEEEDHQLTAFKYELEGPSSRPLFIPFRDATSGLETYGAGRFLILDEPEGDEFVLDFNRAFNPLCNYSPAFNCALPPKENHLSVAIRAGEKTYPH